MKKNISFLIFQLICLTGITLVSSYKIPDLAESNWDTALFLTPIGITKNFLDKNPVMKSFYSDLSPGLVVLPGWKIATLMIFVILLVAGFIKLIKMLAK
ncbi:MAG: hypothetical protein ACXVLQ_12525 [Bacteriovorax sp.]